MRRAIYRFAFFVATVFCLPPLTVADEPAAEPARVKPPQIVLRAANATTFGGQKCLSLTFEVSNPNSASLLYTGYAPDSFDPPLAAGQISPLCQIELKRDGRWRPRLMRDCGFGLGDLELTPGASATFGVMLPADDWQAVKVAIGCFPGFSDEARATTTLWSAEFSRAEIEGADAGPAPPPAPDAGLPLGKWSVEFADGSVEVCIVREDGTASVSEPQRSSAGKARMQDGSPVLVFDDDRTERWTAVGRRFVVEHWFPASRLPIATPVLGIAERVR
ncbi:MAG TPA: hypothetical protein VMV10_29105 [Pirellulales bacterium]|nr:hypothetical protein [Pirellulales bacterium]